jgi:hypothetical protein
MSGNQPEGTAETFSIDSFRLNGLFSDSDTEVMSK